ncbi:isocitrate lyase/phosphoenolpyruvate mutase family protein [Sulfitobacter mediterraneus]|uniref:isocitrate lyase/PEP mutase family protein n=1 Tax=Sulfitobacter mediterraneus TaxID=83219 RepID=UPI001932E788|nr:isocitrate lyase/phosphoenolpyruvate mutase family protein [Sulfitobacter mediterraneus]MBM1631440.1 isocitrate lyase/phosphoenolpyruvate mutase family protein [Sulfitobacter mediterraneus]MBM1639255.1 isocitrate lyase/phosphoenolpyruvate mutase family protein [Sulfitobacter mediterraneus]MBM1643304.1 isocitrate lyase/phosphoenolpyruvate mutase family protein [Sulfitobacter mediterraneus]MBM1647350.1 isocitrate lyase/phosphoenolpyruvate mutase family protein [Sulfitobacter mediterraneus]MBM
MVNQTDKALAFAKLHVKGAPLVLFNAWDAGSAKAVAQGGASAIATGSWSVAAAQGYADGQALPLDLLLQTAGQIVGAVDLPVSVDFEGGYGVEADEVGKNAARLLETGAIGLNFEDRIVGGDGLHPVADQARRIAAIRAAADAAGVPLFINARSDVFFQKDSLPHADLMEEALTRAAAYAEAGANGIFVPGLSDLNLIKSLCDAQSLPVNIMRMGGGTAIADLASAGAARISHGPGPYIAAMETLTKAAAQLYQ